ncbi:hypothetical protein WJX74_010857 [Apatococcus lobatus]|uniref:Uncharacterized protein n=1 Tax=Apatococcus lobatus TaxID=904363 RepID=A0AAW1RAQ3_9CHLO
MRSQRHVLPLSRRLSEPSGTYGFQPGEKDRQDAAGPQGTKGLGQAKKQLSASCWSSANPAQNLQDCSRPAAGSMLPIRQGSDVPGQGRLPGFLENGWKEMMTTGYIKRRELWMVAFFPTIDDCDWLERPRLAPFLPVDPDTGRPDDRNVQDFIAMLKELQSRNNEACRALGKAPAGSKDTLFDQLLWAMERVAKQQYMLTNPEVNRGDSAADMRFWQQRIGGVAADPHFYTTEAGTGFKKSLNFFQGHPVVIQFKKFLTDQLVSNRQGDSDAATAQTMDLVAQVTQPHQVAQKRSQANRNLAMGTRGGKQINQHDPMAVMACERDRFDTLLAGTHGMRPPERLHMRWTNTWFRQGVELSRGAMQQFNLQQMATGQVQVPLYECHVHALLWPEKMTKTQLIGRNVVRHVDPAFCVIGSQARVLFMRVHAFGASFHPDGQLPEGWHQGQVEGLDCEDANAHLHWKLALQQQVYSNENHRAMLVSQGHPAYGGDKNFFIMGRGEVPTQDYAELVGAFFPASMFCSDPKASWDGLLDLMEHQNAINPGLQWLGRVFLAERIHLPGGLRDCLLQDYALLEDNVVADPTSDMVYGSSWFQATMQQLLQAPEGEDQWRRFKAEVCHAHGVGLEALNFIRWSSGNLVMMSMVMQGLVQQHENAALLKSLAKQVQGMSMQQQQLLSPPTKQRRGSLIAASPIISPPCQPFPPMHMQPEAEPDSAVLVEEEFSAPAGPWPSKPCLGIPAAATCPDAAIFSLRGLPDGLQYIPGTGTIRGVAAIMEMWEEGPPVIMSAVQMGVARIPFKQLQHADNVCAKFRSSRDPEKDRMLLQINPVARMVVARTNQLQAMAGPQPLPHKLYRSMAIREVEQLWEDKFRLKNLKAFAKAIHSAMKSDPKFAERSLAEWKALI